MSRLPLYRFRLYIVGDTQNSTQAQANLTALCASHLPGRSEVELVDVLRDPERALADGVMLTPTLVRSEPLPLRKIVGTLSDTAMVLQVLGLEGQAR